MCICICIKYNIITTEIDEWSSTASDVNRSVSLDESAFIYIYIYACIHIYVCMYMY